MGSSRFLMAVGTAALITGGTSVAVAQQQEPGRAAPAEQSAPKSSASPRSGESANQLPGGGAHNGAADTKRKNAAEERGERNNSRRAGEMKSGGRSETTGQAPQSERREGQRSEPNRATEEKSRDRDRTVEERNERGRDRTTVGQGAAPSKGANSNLSVNITPENRTRIHDVLIKERSAPRVDHVDFSLSVGTPVPRSVRIVTVPREIIEIEPQWRGYEYFMVVDQVVIVNPRTMEIVAVVDV
jgi:hypothetical protein